MPADNVTPFRRPPKRPTAPQQRGGMGLKTHRGKAVLVHLLTLATYVCAILFPFPPPLGAPITLIIASCVSLALALGAVALAMSNRYDGMPWAVTHHEHALRTLVIGFVIWSLASALTLILAELAVVAVVAHIIVALWAAVRAIGGIVLAVMRKPIGNPRGWLF